MPPKLTTDKFIEKSRAIHGDRYDYSKVEYVNNYTKVCIVCPIHGEFYITPDSHFRGRGCKLCGTIQAQTKNRMKISEFLEKATKIHNGKYDYSKVKYENTETKIEIICPEHGEFWQTPHHHLSGVGCPKCGIKNISENKIFELIKENFEDAIQQYSPPFLKENGHKQFIDVFIPSKNIGVEYQGRQHFVPIKKFGGKEEFELTKKRDKKKYLKSKEHGIKILFFSYERNTPEDYIDEIIKNENKLIETIKKYGNRL